MLDIPGYAVSSNTISVEVGSDEVIVSSTDTVVVDQDVQVNRSAVFSFLTIVGTSFTISKYNSTRFVDWFTVDNVGVDYTSYIVTGYELFGDVMRD
jgi:hypothetical protein